MVQNQHQTRGGLSFTVVTTERSKSSGIPPLIDGRKRFVNCSDLCSLSLVLSGLGFREGDAQAQFIPYKSPALPFPCLEARPGKNKLTLQTFPKQLLMWDVRNSEFIHGLGCCSGDTSFLLRSAELGLLFIGNADGVERTRNFVKEVFWCSEAVGTWWGAGVREEQHGHAPEPLNPQV